MFDLEPISFAYGAAAGSILTAIAMVIGSYLDFTSYNRRRK